VADLDVFFGDKMDFSGELGGQVAHVELGNLRRGGPVDVFHPRESLARWGTIVATFHE
jgi:hypothetical protein